MLNGIKKEVYDGQSVTLFEGTKTESQKGFGIAGYLNFDLENRLRFRIGGGISKVDNTVSFSDNRLVRSLNTWEILTNSNPFRVGTQKEHGIFAHMSMAMPIF